MDTVKLDSIDELIFALKGRTDIEFLLNGRRGWIGARGKSQLGMCGFPDENCVLFDSPDEVLDYDIGGGDTLRDIWKHIAIISM